MLILTRRIGETLVIGDDITVTILAQRGNQVRVGVSAPPNVRVDREEIATRRTVPPDEYDKTLKRA